MNGTPIKLRLDNLDGTFDVISTTGRVLAAGVIHNGIVPSVVIVEAGVLDHVRVNYDVMGRRRHKIDQDYVRPTDVFSLSITMDVGSIEESDE